MPIVDRREFGGRFTVRENSQRLANYRYLEIQLLEMLGGWCHTMPQLQVKAALAATSTTTLQPPTCSASAWSSSLSARQPGARQ